MQEPAFCVAALVLRAAVGMTFIASGCIKLLRRRLFVDMVASIFRRADKLVWARRIGVAIIAVEIVVGSALLLGVWVRLMSLLLLGLLTLFTGALMALKRSGYSRGCMCFGAFDSARIGPIHHARNGIIAGGIVSLLSVAEVCPGSIQGIWTMPAWVPVLGCFTFLVIALLYLLASSIYDTRVHS